MFIVFELILLVLKITYYYLEAFFRAVVPPRRKDIKGQNVLITGGGGGIGKALAIKFSQYGAKIALWDLNASALSDVADELKVRGATVYTYTCDITNRASIKKCADQMRKDMGELDILVNNAGILTGKPFLELNEEDIRKTFEVNTIAHFWTVKEFLPSMLERKHGHIVTIASMAAKAGSPLLVDYCASKWAAFGFTEALMVEMRALNHDCKIRTTVVCPVFVNTNLIYGEDIKKRIKRNDRFDMMLIEPEDVAKATVDGVLRNKVEVYVPSSSGLVDVARGLLPLKAGFAINDFIECEFRPVKKTE